MASGYLNTIYNEDTRPKTSYPAKLISHLFDRFQLTKGMSMLEPGCGRGEFLQEFAHLGLDVMGVDISEYAQKCSTGYPVHLCDVDSQPLPFKDNTFDVVYSKSFIEHLYYPEKYLSEAYRVLKPGGCLITLVPDWEANVQIYFDDFTHRSPFTKVALEDAYQMYNFENSSVIRFRQLPLVWKFPVLNYLCAAIALFVPHRSKIKAFRWSKELMLVGHGYKPKSDS